MGGWAQRFGFLPSVRREGAREGLRRGDRARSERRKEGEGRIGRKGAARGGAVPGADTMLSHGSHQVEAAGRAREGAAALRKRGTGPTLALLGVTALFASFSALPLGAEAQSDNDDKWEVLQVHVLARHGQREQLVKDSGDFAESGGEGANDSGASALTADGVLQCFRAGNLLRSRYINVPTDEPTYVEDLQEFSLEHVVVRSSDTDRTLASASVLADGMYPPADPDEPGGDEDEDAGACSRIPNGFLVTPVHTIAEEDDIELRAYNKCNTYFDNVDTLYESAEFEARQDAEEDLIMNIRDRLLGTKICETELNILVFVAAEDGNGRSSPVYELKEAYNLYDCLAVTEVKSPGIVSELVTQEQLDKLRNAVNWLEDQKYRPDIVGNMLGGTYVTDMVRTMYLRVRDNAILPPILHVNMAHYPTMKGVGSALGLPNVVKGIPGFASMLIFELVKDKTSGGRDFSDDFSMFGVRVLYHNGDEEDVTDDDGNAILTSAHTVQFSPWGDADPSGVVSWTDFTEWIRENTVEFANGHDWCQACGTWTPTVCLAKQLEDSMTENAGLKGDNDDLKTDNLTLQNELAAALGARDQEDQEDGDDVRGAGDDSATSGSPRTSGGGDYGGGSIALGFFMGLLIGAVGVVLIGRQLMRRKSSMRDGTDTHYKPPPDAGMDGSGGRAGAAGMGGVGGTREAVGGGSGGGSEGDDMATDGLTRGSSISAWASGLNGLNNIWATDLDNSGHGAAPIMPRSTNSTMTRPKVVRSSSNEDDEHFGGEETKESGGGHHNGGEHVLQATV